MNTDAQLIEAMEISPEFTMNPTSDDIAAFLGLETAATTENVFAALMAGTFVVDADTIRQQEEAIVDADEAPAGWTNVDCGRCSGQGHIAAFARINGGRCFDCDGRGVTLVRA